MINKKISNSKRVNDLPLGAQLLFTWLIPHLDCNGCFYGSAQMIKSLVVPRKSWPKSDIEKWLVLMEKSVDFESGQPLLQRYLVGKDQYLFMPGFVDEQIGLRRDKEKPEFPPFDGKNTESVGQTVPLSRTGSRRGREGEVEVEEERRDSPLYPPTVSLPALSEQKVNERIENVIEIYHQNFCVDVHHPEFCSEIEGQWQLSEGIKNDIRRACQKFPPEWVVEALRQAIIINKQSWPYICGILNTWGKEGGPPGRGTKATEGQ
jgi:DnaD/phage-associated family protein